MRSALNTLLGGQCYHMYNVAMGGEEEVAFWERAIKGQVRPHEWNDFLEKRGFRAGVDFPIAHFYK